jgi:hypothetical protein
MNGYALVRASRSNKVLPVCVVSLVELTDGKLN